MKKQVTRKPAAQKLQAIQTSRHLHVVHARHTGHVLPHKSTSYPLLILMLLCIGVLLASWTRFVTADSGSATDVIHASVGGPAPTVGATITEPLNGSTTGTRPITVKGSCPAKTYIALTRNGFPSGTALCGADGTYSLETDLFNGLNILQVQDYDFGNQAGPASNNVTVTYQRVTAAPSGESDLKAGDGAPTSSSSADRTTNPYIPGSPSAATVPEPLILKTDYRFQGFFVGQAASWQLLVQGGTAPYAIAVNWGDGTQLLYSRSVAGLLKLSHVYHNHGGFEGSYVIKVLTTDSKGNQTFLQTVAVINDPTTIQGAGAAKGGLSSGDLSLPNRAQFAHVAHYIWPSYGIVLLMLISFWLGEVREFRFLRNRPSKTRQAHN